MSRPRLSESDLAMMGQLLAGEIARARQGDTQAATSVLQRAAYLVAGGYALPQPLARFLAQRLQAVAADPWSVPLLKRTAAQAREDAKGLHWPMLNATRDAWRAIQAAPRGDKTRATEDEAERLGISVRELRDRFRRFGIA